MNYFSDLISAVQSDLTIGNESTLFDLTKVKGAINRSYHKCVGLFRWPETEDALKTTTESGINYYDYPQLWIPDSMWSLEIDGTDYGDPIGFKDFKYEVANIDGLYLPSGKDRIWTSQWRRFFVYPTPTEDDLDIVVWGQSAQEDLVEDTDITIWSYSMPECNEAVVEEAVAILRSKGENDNGAQFKSISARATLVVAWNKIKTNQDKYKQTRPEFTIPDFFS